MKTLQALCENLTNAKIVDLEVFSQFSGKPVPDITSDSRKVQAGCIFVALTGSHTDGHQYLQQAADGGASLLVIDRQREGRVTLPANVPVMVADSSYQALAELSSRFYGEPGRKLRMIGVTGTNGKTTVTHLIEKILEEAGRETGGADKIGLIGTLGYKSKSSGQYDSTGHTTPMAMELQHILSDMLAEGKEYCVMEVSSHALDQHRTDGCDFDVAVLTNVTQDHLDYHKTMEHYWRAKALLFSNLKPDGEPKAAVINLDSDYAQEFVQALSAGVQLYTYSIDSPEANVRPLNVDYSIAGSTFRVTTPVGEATLALKLGGKFSVYNALAALAAGLGLGIPLETCVRAIEAVEGVRGRFEVVSREPFVIVDYAHTPDGLENVLSAARVVTPEGGRLVAVFGCGGDRDATKRPKMGHIVERLADVVVVTSDNPRSEDPQQIITDILAGIQTFDASRMIVNADREQAIHQAIDLAKPNDIIVVAGKGHEDYQILADRTIHFDDREVVQKYVAKKQATPSV